MYVCAATFSDLTDANNQRNFVSHWMWLRNCQSLNVIGTGGSPDNPCHLALAAVVSLVQTNQTGQLGWVFKACQFCFRAVISDTLHIIYNKLLSQCFAACLLTCSLIWLLSLYLDEVFVHCIPTDPDPAALKTSPFSDCCRPSHFSVQTWTGLVVHQICCTVFVFTNFVSS
jgi:hypothetical protein